MKLLKKLFDFRKNIWIYCVLDDFGNFEQAKNYFGEMSFILNDLAKVECSKMQKCKYISAMHGPIDMLYSRVSFPKKLEEEVRKEIRGNSRIRVMEKDVFTTELF